MPGTKRKGKGDAWYLEVTLGTNAKGKPVRYNRTFHGSEKEAEKALARFYIECEDGKVRRESNMTVSELSDIYIEEYVKRYLKQSNMKVVTPAIKRLKEAMGHRKINKLTRLDVQRWVNSMSEPQPKKNDKVLSPKSVRNYYSILSGMMNFAVQMELIDNSPCHNIRLPRNQKKEARYYNKDEVALFLQALENVSEHELKYKAVVYVALFGGLRNGEIMGLNWDDLDEDERTISIHRTRYIKKGGIYEDVPKTQKSIREITLPDNVIALLKELKVQQMKEQLILGNKWENSPAIFKNSMGNHMHPNATAKWLRKFLKRNDLPYISMHGLRHTHTSLLAYLNTDKLVISRRLGHSQLSTTLNIYTHIFEEPDKQIADGLNLFTENLRNEHIKNG
ncbi:MAG: site-specific integrase [Eubacteriales bacterium]|nr:site-specific integrase [Eubacteriales bacterium]